MTVIHILAALVSGALLVAPLLDIAKHGALTLSNGTVVDFPTTLAFVICLGAVAFTCFDAAVGK